MLINHHHHLITTSKLISNYSYFTQNRFFNFVKIFTVGNRFLQGGLCKPLLTCVRFGDSGIWLSLHDEGRLLQHNSMNSSLMRMVTLASPYQSFHQTRFQTVSTHPPQLTPKVFALVPLNRPEVAVKIDAVPQTTVPPPEQRQRKRVQFSEVFSTIPR